MPVCGTELTNELEMFLPATIGATSMPMKSIKRLA